MQAAVPAPALHRDAQSALPDMAGSPPLSGILGHAQQAKSEVGGSALRLTKSPSQLPSRSPGVGADAHGHTLSPVYITKVRVCLLPSLTPVDQTPSLPGRVQFRCTHYAFRRIHLLEKIKSFLGRDGSPRVNYFATLKKTQTTLLRVTRSGGWGELADMLSALTAEENPPWASSVRTPPAQRRGLGR